MSTSNKCENCGAPLRDHERDCPYCGTSRGYGGARATNSYQSTAYNRSNNQTYANREGNYSTPNNTAQGSRRILIAILSFFLCAFGVPYFMLGNKRMGVMCILFTCCSGGALSVVPGILGIILGIKLLTMDDAQFEATYGVSSNMN